MNQVSPRFRIGIDTGGTVTDVVAVNEVTGEVVTTKTPSTPEDPSIAGLEGLRKVLRLAGRRPVVFDGAPSECPIYARARLGPADVVEGPAIVEEFGSTTVVLPGLRLEVDRFANMIVTQGRA